MGELIYLDDRRADRLRRSATRRPTFFFDLGCPLSYLTAERDRAHAGRRRWVPVAAVALPDGGRAAARARGAARARRARRAGAAAAAGVARPLPGRAPRARCARRCTPASSAPAPRSRWPRAGWPSAAASTSTIPRRWPRPRPPPASRWTSAWPPPASPTATRRCWRTAERPAPSRNHASCRRSGSVGAGSRASTGCVAASALLRRAERLRPPAGARRLSATLGPAAAVRLAAPARRARGCRPGR